MTRLKWVRLGAALIAAGTSIGSGTAGAGDFYLRAGAGLDRPAETAFTDLDCSSVSPAALYGCGRGGDGAPYRSRGGFGTAPVLEFGLEYAAASAVLLEALAEYRPRFAFEGRANFLVSGRRQSVEANLSSLSALLVACIDLPRAGRTEARPSRAVRRCRRRCRPNQDRRNPHDLSEGRRRSCPVRAGPMSPGC